jgi:hypothetical protein
MSEVGRPAGPPLRFRTTAGASRFLRTRLNNGAAAYNRGSRAIQSKVAREFLGCDMTFEYDQRRKTLLSFGAFSLPRKPDAHSRLAIFARSCGLAAIAATFQAALPRSIRGVMPFAARQAGHPLAAGAYPHKTQGYRPALKS